MGCLKGRSGPVPKLNLLAAASSPTGWSSSVATGLDASGAATPEQAPTVQSWGRDVVKYVKGLADESHANEEEYLGDWPLLPAAPATPAAALPSSR